MDTIEKILANAKPSIAKTREHVISDDRRAGYLTAFGEMRPLGSEEIKFVRNYLGL